MSIDLQEPEAVDDALAAIDEFHATQEECDEFFAEIFDELQTLSLELYARHKCLESSVTAKDGAFPPDESLSACRDDFRRAVEQLQDLSSNIDIQLTRLTAVAAGTAASKARAPHDGEHQVQDN